MMYKILFVALLIILIGLLAWDLSVRTTTPAMRVDSTHFKWVTCPSCERMFYVETTQKQGWCPYDGTQFNFTPEK